MRTAILFCLVFCGCAYEPVSAIADECGPANVDVSRAPAWAAWRTESAARIFDQCEFVIGNEGAIVVKAAEAGVNGPRVFRNQFGTIFVTEDADACEIARMLSIVAYGEDRSRCEAD